LRGFFEDRSEYGRKDRDDLLGCVAPATEAHAHPALEQKTTETEGGTVAGGEEAAVPRQVCVELSTRDGGRDTDDARALVEGGLLEAAKTITSASSRRLQAGKL
jgi:hypothetical protein